MEAGLESLFVGKDHDLLAQIGNREPTNAREARAIVAGIRASKGYLDEQTKDDLEKVPDRSRPKLKRFIYEKREMEAAYTRKSVTSVLQHLSC
jgi:succinate dehydrogenase flavin-adding protein (antitoxin of CptAB toxin-antitoxin module)